MLDSSPKFNQRVQGCVERFLPPCLLKSHPGPQYPTFWVDNVRKDSKPPTSPICLCNTWGRWLARFYSLELSLPFMVGKYLRRGWMGDISLPRKSSPRIACRGWAHAGSEQVRRSWQRFVLGNKSHSDCEEAEVSGYILMAVALSAHSLCSPPACDARRFNS